MGRSPTLTTLAMGPLDALWHLLNFFAPALGVGVLAPLFAKALWRSALRGRLPALIGWTTLACAVALVGGLVVLGRDGRMATYGAMVVAAALALWLAGFRPSRG
jgi:hypothetical protein